jgi:hypothetical protein
MANFPTEPVPIDLFEQKIHTIKLEHEQEIKRMTDQHEHGKERQIKLMERRKKFYDLFRSYMSQDQIKQLINHGKLCVRCHSLGQSKEEDFSQKMIIEGQIYCDVHGDLQKNHRPIHNEESGEMNCESCAILDCPFKSPDHYRNQRDGEGCPECYDMYF